MIHLSTLLDSSNIFSPEPLRAAVLNRRVRASEATTRLLTDLVFGVGHRTDYAPSRTLSSRAGAGNMHHGIESENVIKILGEAVETSRKSWRVSLVEEGGQTLVELRLCRRAPDGSLTPTRHRSTFRADVATRVAAMMGTGR